MHFNRFSIKVLYSNIDAALSNELFHAVAGNFISLCSLKSFCEKPFQANRSILCRKTPLQMQTKSKREEGT